jgi:hypothetical protein
MKELDTISANYAAGKANEVMEKAIAQAYADGYRDGYKDREEEFPVDLRDNKTEFVDLGLPSGTMWAKEFEKDGDKVHYLPYCDASTLSLPTEEQWNELLSFCRWEFTYVSNYSRKYDCIGPNGKVITFKSYGFHKVDETIEQIERIYFWLKDSSEEPDKKLVYMFYDRGEIKTISKSFMGFKYPVRLVQIRKEK